MPQKIIIEYRDLETEIMQILLYTTKGILTLLERKDEMQKDTLEMCEKIQFEQRVANLFSVLYICKNNTKFFTKSEQKATFIDRLSKHFFETLSSSSVLYNNREQIEKRLIFYYDLMDKINHSSTSMREGYIFQLEKFYENNIDIHETDLEIQNRISEDATGSSTWYAYICMQSLSANEILNKYESVNFT